MMTKFALYVPLQAKPGKEKEVDFDVSPILAELTAQGTGRIDLLIALVPAKRDERTWGRSMDVARCSRQISWLTCGHRKSVNFLIAI
jgi:hypothetical protein